MSSIWSGFFTPSAAMTRSMQPEAAPVVTSVRQFYQALDAYYQNNNLYDNLRALAVAKVLESDVLAGLRNPAHRVVEFYAKKLWPGSLPNALPIVTDNRLLPDAIRRLHTDSNFGAMKQVLAREAPLYGDCFIKVATKNGPPGQDGLRDPRGVYLQRIDPKLVTDFAEDERKFTTMIRLDIQQFDSLSGAFASKWRTEVWDKIRFRAWVHTKGEAARIEDLGDPVEEVAMSVYGIDFVPFVRAPFLDIGDMRGVSAFQHALDKIDALNRDATRLHGLLFRNNKNTWVAESAMRDAGGRLLASLDFGGDGDDEGEGDGPRNRSIVVGDEEIVSLPGGYTLNSRVPQLAYDAALAILESHAREVEDDLPEIAYYRTRDLGANLSGVALRLILGPAIDTVIEARGNLEGALIRAHQMALTIGVNLKLYDAGLGTYEDGSFVHSFADRPVIPLSELEEAQVAKAKQDAGVPRRQVLIDTLGYDADTVDRWEADRQRAADQMLLQAQAQRAQLALQQDQAAAAQQSPRDGAPPGGRQGAGAPGGGSG